MAVRLHGGDRAAPRIRAELQLAVASRTIA